MLPPVDGKRSDPYDQQHSRSSDLAFGTHAGLDWTGPSFPPAPEPERHLA